MAYDTSCDFNSTIVVDHLQSIFNKKILKKLAVESGFIKRFTSRLDGHEIALAIVEKGLTGDKCPLSICCDAIASINPRAKMTVQSLQERINSPECACFFKTILEGCLQHHLYQDYSKLISELSPMGKTKIHQYSAVIAIDCTEIALNPLLKEDFKGSGGEKNAEACLKILALLNIRDFTFKNLSISDRNTPDSVLGKALGGLFQANAMYLLDKGFFSIEILDTVQAKGGYYITPLHAKCNVYTHKTSLRPLSLASHIAKSFKKRGYFDQILFLSNLKKPVRFVAYQLKDKSTQKRLKAYLKQCRKAKRPPTEESLARQGMMILITNDLSITPEVIACLYRLRWQIELVFKNWKSQMKIGHCLGKNPNRIRVLIYGRLIAATILSLILAPVLLILEAYYDKELSLHKTLNWIAQGSRAFKVLCGDANTLKSLFNASLKWLCKEDNRHRRTTKQFLTETSENFSYTLRRDAYES